METKFNFWYDVEVGIKSSSTRIGKRNNFLDLVRATYHIKESLKGLDSYLTDPQDSDSCVSYFFNRGYLFSLKYYRDNPDTSKKNSEKTDILLSLGVAISKLEDLLLDKKRSVTVKKSIREGLRKLDKESENLLNDEIHKLGLVGILSNVQNKKGYLSNFLGPHGKLDLSNFLLGQIQDSPKN